jgi:hypothetical protein
MKTRPLMFALSLVVALAFSWAVLRLFETRFARGDVYPAYSTLRTDPLGAKAFYDSLVRLGGLEVSRNEEPLEQLRGGKGTALLLAGLTDLAGSEREIDRLENFARSGGRLVLAFYPQAKETELAEAKPSANATPTATPTPSASPEEEPLLKVLATRAVAKRWELSLHANDKVPGHIANVIGLGGLDPQIPWHSALHFKDSGPQWRTIYSVAQFPVVIERAMGEGTIVLASDSYFLSNEALRREPRPRFLAWLIGPNERVVVDETHLGVSETPGVSTLMRRYHLEGLIAGLLLLAFLAVWKNAARLVPSSGIKTDEEEIVAGKESFGGFVNLLRRNIRPHELLGVCLEQWAKFLPHDRGKSQERLACVEAIVRESTGSREHRREPVEIYQEISRTLEATKWKPHN